MHGDRLRKFLDHAIEAHSCNYINHEILEKLEIPLIAV